MLKVNNFILKAEPLDAIGSGSLGASAFHREMLQLSKLDKVALSVAKITDMNPLGEIQLLVDFKLLSRTHKDMEFADDGLAIKVPEDMVQKEVARIFKNRFINQRERFALPLYDGQLILIIYVEKVTPINVKSRLTYGVIEQGGEGGTEATETDVMCKARDPKKMKIQTSRVNEKQVFKKNMNFQELGIGGLDAEFNEIFRRAFNSRRFAASTIAKYGIQHVKGMLLYGPPGTGKTLIARKIADALNCVKPQVVNGPEIFDKFVGGSEEKIRALFEPAEKDMKEKGDESDLHVIIFDEIDAICRSRGSTGSSGTGVNESVVNQLLSKMDGVDSLNNILIIGMTNRKDMIDEAILRPGRLEIHLEIGLPDLRGRI